MREPACVRAPVRAPACVSGAAHEKVMEVAKRRQRKEDGGRESAEGGR